MPKFAFIRLSLVPTCLLQVKLHPGCVLGADRTSRALADLGTDWIM